MQQLLGGASAGGSNANDESGAMKCFNEREMLVEREESQMQIFECKIKQLKNPQQIQDKIKFYLNSQNYPVWLYFLPILIRTYSRWVISCHSLLQTKNLKFTKTSY